MDTTLAHSKRRKWVTARIAGGLLVAIPTVLGLASCRAESRAAELVTAAADLQRCMAGDDVKLDRTSVRLGYERRTVIDLPDMRTASPCLLALDVVKEKWDAYEPTWFNSAKSKDENGLVLGERFLKAHDEFRALPLDKSTDVVYLHSAKYGRVLEAGDIAFDMYEAAKLMYAKDGASEKDIDKAGDTRNRSVPRVAEKAPRGRVVATVAGKVSPVDWQVYPSGKGTVLHALSSKGESVVAWTDDGAAWKTAKGPLGFEGQTNLELRVIDAPAGQRWFILAHGEKDNTQTHVGKIGEGQLEKPTLLTAAPRGWKLAPGSEREVVVLANDVKAFPVWRIAEKSKDEIKAEQKERKEWEENYADKDVQALLTLAEQRRLGREAVGVDDEHKRVDGIAYADGTGEPTVLELPGFGLGGLVPGAEPMAVVGTGGLPAHQISTFAIPAVGEPMGIMTQAEVTKPVEPSVQRSAWFRCMASDGTYWVTTATGSFLIGMQPGVLQLLWLEAYADDGSHIGCGPSVATVALPFAKDRIFANLLTVRGSVTEGAKITTTAGTTVDGYNATSSTAATSGAVVIGWVARGYAIYSVNLKTDNDFMAPQFLGEAHTDGSYVSGLRFVGMGQRMLGVVARESCDGENCTTAFELLVSDDNARSWAVPH